MRYARRAGAVIGADHYGDALRRIGERSLVWVADTLVGRHSNFGSALAVKRADSRVCWVIHIVWRATRNDLCPRQFRR